MQDLEAVLKIDENIKKAQCALFWVDVETHEANLQVCVRMMIALGVGAPLRFYYSTVLNSIPPRTPTP